MEQQNQLLSSIIDPSMTENIIKQIEITKDTIWSNIQNQNIDIEQKMKNIQEDFQALQWLYQQENLVVNDEIKRVENQILIYQEKQQKQNLEQTQKLLQAITQQQQKQCEQFQNNIEVIENLNKQIQQLKQEQLSLQQTNIINQRLIKAKAEFHSKNSITSIIDLKIKAQKINLQNLKNSLKKEDNELQTFTQTYNKVLQVINTGAGTAAQQLSVIYNQNLSLQKQILKNENQKTEIKNENQNLKKLIEQKENELLRIKRQFDEIGGKFDRIVQSALNADFLRKSQEFERKQQEHQNHIKMREERRKLKLQRRQERQQEIIQEEQQEEDDIKIESGLKGMDLVTEELI